MSLLCIMGPTASGKSQFAIRKALECGGEIISADSMQVYRHLDIGTAKIPFSEREGVTHHLIDVCDIGDSYDVNMWVSQAEALINDIFSRGKRPIICGGTGYYVKSLLYGLDVSPGDKNLRAELDAQYDSIEAEPLLLERMRTLDPLAFAQYSTNRRKLIRALEVKLLTGRSILEYYSQPQTLRFDVESYWLNPDRDLLRERINKRVNIMLNQGWIEETQHAEELGLFFSPTARQTIGYSIIYDYLKSKITYEQMRELIAVRTAQYARRQRAWFRHQHPESVPLTHY